MAKHNSGDTRNISYKNITLSNLSSHSGLHFKLFADNSNVILKIIIIKSPYLL